MTGASCKDGTEISLLSKFSVIMLSLLELLVFKGFATRDFYFFCLTSLFSFCLVDFSVRSPASVFTPNSYTGLFYVEVYFYS